MNFYPYYNHMIRRYREICGTQTGIGTGNISLSSVVPGIPDLKVLTSDIPKYHRTIYKNPTADVEYHLAGYGLSYEETFTRMTGESIERYAGLVSYSLLEDQVIHSSRKELSKNNTVMPIEYMQLYSQEQLDNLNKYLPQLKPSIVDEDTELDWLECNSLFDPDKKIFVPAQMFCMGYMNQQTSIYVPSFSTGTATHVSVKKALRNAIEEVIELDALMINWYAGIKSEKINIDDPQVKKILKDINIYGDSSIYDILPFECTLEDIDVPTIAVLLKNKNGGVPHLLYGGQTGLEPKNVLIRGAMESGAISYLSLYRSIFKPEEVMTDMSGKSGFTDLDTNVIHYSNLYNRDEKNTIFEDYIEGEVNLSDLSNRYSDRVDNECIDSQLKYLIEQVKKVSEFAVYKVITPPEIKDKGWHVIKVFIPELVGMCLPGFPPSLHKRLQQYGGVVRNEPHPLP